MTIDTVFPDCKLTNRRVTAAWAHHAASVFIIALEALVAVLCLWGAWALWDARAGRRRLPGRQGHGAVGPGPGLHRLVRHLRHRRRAMVVFLAVERVQRPGRHLPFLHGDRARLPDRDAAGVRACRRGWGSVGGSGARAKQDVTHALEATEPELSGREATHRPVAGVNGPLRLAQPDLDPSHQPHGIRKRYSRTRSRDMFVRRTCQPRESGRRKGARRCRC